MNVKRILTTRQVNTLISGYRKMLAAMLTGSWRSTTDGVITVGTGHTTIMAAKPRKDGKWTVTSYV